MMEQLENTLAAFTRSASRRVDAELCIISLCQPELQLDAKALNARLTRLEEQLKSGSFTVAAAAVKAPAPAAEEPEEERPPMPTDEDAPMEMAAPEPVQDQTPVGFWSELVASLRQELRPPVSGFFLATPNSPVQGVLQGNQVVLRCTNPFTLEMINKPEVLMLVGRKAAAILGRPVSAKAVDKTAGADNNAAMERLLAFGRDHSDIVRIKEN